MAIQACRHNRWERLLVLLLLSVTAAGAATIVVDDNHPSAADSNPGTTAEPLKTVQAALDLTGPGDTVSIKPGVYDLAGYARTFDFTLALVGENSSTTLLRNGGTLKTSAPLTVKGLGFMDYGDPEVFQLATSAGDTLDGVLFEDCLFRAVRVAIDNSGVSEGTLRNVVVRNCRFLDLHNVKVVGIRLVSGTVENISIYRNTFQNLMSDTKECIGIFVGSNETRDRTRNVYVVGNDLQNITGPTNLVNGVGWEVHGILCYGSNVQVLANSVQGLNGGDDHEAIYLKARDSVIADNDVLDSGSGSGGADITLKGGDQNEGNLVCGNRIIGSVPGRGMMVHGGATVRHNRIRKTASGRGIDAYAYGKSVYIVSNRVEVARGSAVSLEDAVGGFVLSNCLVCYSGTATRVVNCTNVTVAGNMGSSIPGCSSWTNQAPRIDSGIAPAGTIFDVPTKVLSVVASDPDRGPCPLRYTWSRPTGPARVVFRPNHATNASSTTATFCAPGDYTIQVEIFDGINRTVEQVLIKVALVSSDTDGNLIADAWEVMHGLNPLNRDGGQDDEDGDRITNLDEYVTGTSPTNGNPRFAVRGIEPSMTGVCFAVPSASGRVYDVDYRDDLIGTNAWARLTNDVPGTGELLLIKTPWNLGRCCFYQVRVSVP